MAVCGCNSKWVQFYAMKLIVRCSRQQQILLLHHVCTDPSHLKNLLAASSPILPTTIPITENASANTNGRQSYSATDLHSLLTHTHTSTDNTPLRLPATAATGVMRWRANSPGMRPARTGIHVAVLMILPTRNRERMLRSRRERRIEGRLRTGRRKRIAATLMCSCSCSTVGARGTRAPHPPATPSDVPASLQHPPSLALLESIPISGSVRPDSMHCPPLPSVLASLNRSLRC